MSSADARMHIFVLLVLIMAKEFCDGYPGGAIVFPKDNVTEKPGVKFDSRLGTPPQSNDFQHSREYHRQHGFQHSRDYNQQQPGDFKHSPEYHRSQQAAEVQLADISSNPKNNISALISKNSNSVSAPKNNPTIIGTMNPKDHIVAGNNKSRNTTTSSGSDDDDDEEYGPKYATKVRQNCKCLTVLNTCSETDVC